MFLGWTSDNNIRMASLKAISAPCESVRLRPVRPPESMVVTMEEMYFAPARSKASLTTAVPVPPPMVTILFTWYIIPHMSTVGVVGYGYVGKAVEYGFKPNNKVLVHDKFLPSLPLSRIVKKSQIIFVAVPTPMDAAYQKIDLSIVGQVVGDIVKLARKFKKRPIIVIKSTVIPGTTRKLGEKFKYKEIAFNPEFLTEANYLDDFVNADRIIVGSDVDWVRQRVVDLYRESFSKTKIFQTDPVTAEMVKYMANTFLSTKVMFANEMYDLCEKLGIKYEEVKSMVVADHRIFNSHLDITTQRGFGGKCFPKDTVALLGLAKELGIDLSVLEAAWKKNLKIRKVRDWEDIPGAVATRKFPKRH